MGVRRFEILVLLAAGCAQAATLSPLLARGYTVLPEPQKVELGADAGFGVGWRLETEGVPAGDSTAATLREDFSQRFGLKEAAGGTLVRLAVRPGTVAIGPAQDKDKEVLAQQAYRMDLAAGRISIQANAAPGLFYGAQTLVQLLKQSGGRIQYPTGTITDWPDLQMRILYWDDAHHLERLSELKRALRQAAFFKINGFAIKLEGHFQFKSAPAVVEPNALTPAELQELTDYGLRYHIQVIPFLDGPAHIAFILKHPQYAPLRAFPDSNYELCTTNPDSYKMLEGMFQDLLDANKGSKWVVLSTDEPYYVGMADNAQCREKAEAERLGSRGKLLAQFETKVGNFLHERGRTVLFWGEFPLKVGDIASLPSHLVNGEVYGPEFDAAYKARGIRQSIYTSTQGEEPLFPDYFYLPASRRLHPARTGAGRVADMFESVSFNSARKNSDLLGMFVAAWADAGLHTETFWLGYATGTAAGWHPGAPSAAEMTGKFFPLFYGDSVVNMERAYQLLSHQAQFWEDSWEKTDSTSRKPIWGNSEEIYSTKKPAEDQTLPLPARPDASLKYDRAWREQNQQRLRLAQDALAENDELIAILNDNLTRAEFNRYNLEVLLSVARLCRQNLEMLAQVGAMDRALASASDQKDPREAVAALDQALDTAERIRAGRNAVLRDTVATWQKSWYPRGGEHEGRRFRHELDDVKDHVPDRTEDMSYLVLRELLLPMGEWVEGVQSARNAFAQAHGLPARTVSFNWRSLD